MFSKLDPLFDALARGRRFVTHDIWYIGRPGEEVPSGFIIKQVRVFILLVRNLLQGAFLMRAAALTFTSLLSIVPFLTIVLIVIQKMNLGGYAMLFVLDVVPREKANQNRPPDVQQAATAAPVDWSLLEHRYPVGAIAEGRVTRLTDDAAYVELEPGLIARLDVHDILWTKSVSSPEEVLSENQIIDVEVLRVDTAARTVDVRFDASSDANDRIVRAFLKWVFADVNPQTVNVRPVEGAPVRDPIEVILSFARNLASPAQATPGTIIGLVFFVLVTVFGMMWNIESAFNAIWGVRRTRSWVRIFSDYVLITLLFPIAMAGVLGVMLALQHPSVSLGPFAVTLRIAQYASVWAVFTVLYAIVPNTKVKWRYALLGGVVAGTLWSLASWAYLYLQIGVARDSLIYSSFALFPLLITWIYISWIILLFGAELTFAYQNERTFAMERHAAGVSFAYREAVSLRAMLEICHRFKHGLPPLATEEAAREWNVPTRVINETLDLLQEAGLVNACATDPVTFCPARSLDKITVGDVVRALRDAGREPSALREDDLLRPLLDEVEGRDRVMMNTPLEGMVEQVFPQRPAIEVVATHEHEKELPAPQQGTG